MKKKKKDDTFLDYPLWDVIEVPFMDKNLLIFSGDEGRKIFNEKVKETFPEWGDDIESDGFSYCDYIYVEDIKNNISVLFHELGHYMEYCYKYLGCEKESEFKARLSEVIYMDIYRALRGKYK